MKEATSARMWRNLGRGIAWIAAGAVAVFAVELAWDHLAGREYAQAGGGDAPGSREQAAEPGLGGLMDAALGGEMPDAGELPGDFAEEYLDVGLLGEVSVSSDGAVVGIVSDLPSEELFGRCSDGLRAHGWVALKSGAPLRCTFSKGRGTARWLFLDVTQVSGSGVAVIVLENRR